MKKYPATFQADPICTTKLTPERMEELDRAWDESAKWTEEEYLDWFLDLTQEEQDLISEWDRRYTLGVSCLCADILAAEQRRQQQP